MRGRVATGCRRQDARALPPPQLYHLCDKSKKKILAQLLRNFQQLFALDSSLPGLPPPFDAITLTAWWRFDSFVILQISG